MAQISFEINNNLKKDFENVCEELGLNPTTTLTTFIKEVCREHKIPFEVSIYNSNTLKILDETSENENLSESFDDVEDLFEKLNT